MMKAILVVTVVLTSLGAGEADDFCKNKDNGNYANPRNCNEYITCSNGRLYNRPCPSNLVWSDNEKRCNWENSAEPPCPKPTRPPPPPITTALNTTTGPPPTTQPQLRAPDYYCKDKVYGYYPHPTTCRGFVICFHGKATPMWCPGSLVWNDKKKTCDWPRSVKPPCTTSKPQPPKDYCKNKTDGNYVDPTTCYGFISCSNGNIYQMDCPAPLVWNDKKKECDWAYEVKPPCKSSPPAFFCKQENQGDFCSGKADGNYPDSSNCHGYIACSNGLAYHMPCQPYLKWNDKKKWCDWPQNAHPQCPCSSAVTTAKPTKPTVTHQAPPNLDDFCKNKTNDTYPNPTTCHGFISCSNYITYQMPCPANLKWNDKKKQCDWPQNAFPPCGNKKGPQFKCKKNGNSVCKHRSNGNYPDPNNCHGYIACSNGITYRMPCPDSLKWNQRKKRCDWARHANPPCASS